MPGLGYIQLLGIYLLLGLQACTSAVQVAEVGPCSPIEDASGLITLQTDCKWTALEASGIKQGTRVIAARKRLDEAGTVSIFAGDTPVVSSTAGVSPGKP